MSQEKYADTITKLLRKAESTTPEEAELLVAKAQELMAKYAIDELMLDAMKPQAEREKLTTLTIHYHSSYSRAQFFIGAAIARANGCKVLISKGKDLMRTDLIIHGFESDVRRTELLNSSLQIQAMRSLGDFWSKHPYAGAYSAREKFKERRQFLLSFAQGLTQQLANAVEAGRKQAALESSRITGDELVSVSTSMALVIRSRSEQVDDYVSNLYGDDIRRSRGNFAGGSRAGRSAGHDAGFNSDANVPQQRQQVGA